MLKRIRMEASKKGGSKIVVILPDGEQIRATVMTILGGGPIEVKSATEFIWIETTDKLIVDGVEVA